MSRLNPVKWLRSSLSRSIATFVVASIAVSIAAVGGSVYYTLSNKTLEEAVKRQQANFRAALSIVEAKVPGTTVKWSGDNITKITMDSIPELEGHDFIDSLSKVTGGHVSIYRWDAEKKGFHQFSTTLLFKPGIRSTKFVMTAGPVFEQVSKGRQYLGELNILGVDYVTLYQPVVNGAGDIIGMFMVGDTRARMSAGLMSALDVLWIMSCIALVAATAIAIVVSRYMLRPIPRITAAMTEIADGNLEQEVPYTSSENELGAIASAVQVFKDNMLKAKELTAREIDEMRVREERGRRIEELTGAFDAEVASLMGDVSGAVSDVDGKAGVMSTLAEDANHRATLVASAAEEASANVQTVAAATEELSASIHEIGRQVNTSSEIAVRAVDQATRTNNQVKELSTAAQKIGDVLGLISDIAAQTNLLALNATI